MWPDAPRRNEDSWLRIPLGVMNEVASPIGVVGEVTSPVYVVDEVTSPFDLIHIRDS